MSKTHRSSKMNRKIYYTQIINYTEGIQACNLDKDINNLLLEKIKHKLGNKCTKNGYVIKDSIKILERSIGTIKTTHFNGLTTFNIKLEVKVCNPSEGDIVSCQVIGKNKMGILAKQFPMLIALSKIHHTNLSRFDSIMPNDEIKIQVIDSKFSINDEEIQVIGKLYDGED
jgi:DNA-directed RNA polymerase subunit E'/Rpb7